MKKSTIKKLVSFVLAAALVIGALNFNVFNAKAADETPTATATGAFAEGSGDQDLTPSIQYTINHSPITETENEELHIVVALDVSTSMVKNKYPSGSTKVNHAADSDNSRYCADGDGKNANVYDKSQSRIPEAAEAAKSFVSIFPAGTDVSVIGFKDTVVTKGGNTASDQIDNLAAWAHAKGNGTNIADAVDTAKKSLLAYSTGRKILVIASDGEPWPNDGKAEKSLKAAKDAGIEVYAIGLATDVGVFTKERVSSYKTANSASELAEAFSDIAKSIYRYADAWIVATPGTYMEYIGNADNVSIPESGDYAGKLVWDATTVTKSGNVQTSPAIDFAVKVDGLTASDTMDATTKDAIIKSLINKANAGDEEIHLSTNEEGILTITVDVTKDAKLYYRYEGTTTGPVDVDIQATATIYVGAYPQYEYEIEYYIDGQKVELEQPQTVSFDFDVTPTTGDAIDYVRTTSELGLVGEYEGPAISGLFTTETDDGATKYWFEVRYSTPAPIPEIPVEKQSTVRFIVDGNENNPYYKETRVVGASVDVPANPTKGGYSFQGWSLDGTTPVSVITEHGEADVTYYAVFKLNETNNDPIPTPKEDPPYIPPYEEPTEEEPTVELPEPEVPASPEIVVPEPEVPASPEVVVPEPEVPAGEPEIELPEPEVPAGEALPQTGTTPVVVFYGIGAACVVFGAVIFFAARKKRRV
ncbi:MAG: VWA domain-containing protein [Lachnospiraceae bacterium]|nr:VWA domain-containing protein [Lachnospiraceae bacterium]